MELVKSTQKKVYEKLISGLSDAEVKKIEELNRKLPNPKPKDINPIYIAKVGAFLMNDILMYPIQSNNGH